MNNEKANANDNLSSSMIMNNQHKEEAKATGIFVVECFGADGKLKWKDNFKNTVVTAGKNLALDTFLAGSGYSVVGPYIGLIGAVSYTAIDVADTMSSHAGWTESGITNAPTYSGGRKTAVFNAASAGGKALTAPLSFTFTGSGTVKGVFLVFGAGAVATVDNTSGTLYSAGLLSAGDRAVINTDVLNISYTAFL